MGIREAITGPALCPPWLCEYGSDAQRYMAVMGYCIDALLEKQEEAQAAKLPGQADASLIPFQAADRVMVQGPAEPNDAFIQRMIGFLDSWAIAGSRPAVLREIQGYLYNSQPGVIASLPECLIVGGHNDMASASIWDVLTYASPAGALPARSFAAPANWNWDGKNVPTRSWLVLFMHLVPTGQSGMAATVASIGGSGVAGVTSGFQTWTGLAGMTANNVQQYLTTSGTATGGNAGTFQITSVLSPTSVIVANPKGTGSDADSGSIVWSVGAYPYIGPAPVWGSPSFVWGAGSWGLNCSPLVMQSIRSIVKTRKSAATYYPSIIVSFGGGDGTAGNEFSPLSAQGSGNPDGTWGYPSKLVNGCAVPAFTPLNPFTVPCDGTGVSLQCFEKNRT